MAFSKDSFEGLLIDGVKLTEKVLGKGAYGKVVEVVWNGTMCAAKQVHEIFIEEVTPAERARVVKDFEREFQTWAKLRHPNIVILLGVFFIKDSPRIVLEKMDTSLRLYLENHTKADFPLVHKIDVLKQVAQGLCYLHNQNPPLVHHDLSPNNILLNEISFATKLTDFGMTRAINPSALTRMSSIKGTLPFMAPESLRSQPRYDDKLDTFSYGNIIISTVTHKWPIPCDPNRYEGEKLVALTEYERREEYMKFFDDNEKKILAPTVKRCLENRPDRRPTSLTLVDEINAAWNFPQAKTWSQQVFDLKNERQQLFDQVASQQENIEVLQKRMVVKEEEKSALLDLNTHLLQEKRAVQIANTHLTKEQTALKGTNARLVEEKRALQETNTRLAERGRGLQGLNKRLVEEKGTLQTCCAQIQDASAQLQEEIKNFQESYSKVNLKIVQLQAAALNPDVKTQLEEVGPLFNTRLQENDLWYLVDVRWIKQWKKYVGFDSWDLTQVGDDSANPGPLDNRNLLLGQDDDTLKDHLMIDREYSLIPETAWDKLTTWYGISKGSRSIARKVIEWGMYVKHLKAEIYLIRLELGVHPLNEGEKTITKTFSRVDKMRAVKEVIMKEFDLPTNKDTRLWHRCMAYYYVEVKDDDMLQESGVYTGQLMFLEVKNDDGTWPRAPPDVQTQQNIIRPLLDTRLQENDTWFLVDVRWMKQWKKYVGFDSWDRTQVGNDSANPGPLDNSNLFLGQDGDTLKDHLREDPDYSLIPETAWNKLTTWYGIAEGSRPIARKAIEWGMYVKYLKVEVYLIRLELGVYPLKEGEKTITRTFSRVDKMSAVKEVIVKEFDLPTNKDTRLWHRYMTNSYEHVKDDDMLQESGIYTGQLMFLEVKKDDGTWPRDTYTQGSMNTARSSDTAVASGGSSY